MRKKNMIDEKYIARITVDEAVIAQLKDLIARKNLNMKKISEMDETIDYGYLRQVMLGNHPTVSYDFMKRLCKCLDIDTAEVYEGLLSYA